MRWYRSLRRTGEIAYVRRAGRRVSRPTLSAFGLAGGPPGARFCIAVSKEVGNSVIRNLVRRRIRGALDGLGAAGAEAEPLALRVLIVARPAAATLAYGQLANDVRAAVAALRPAGS